MSLSLGLDINNFLTNSETQKSTLFDDIDKLFGNKPFLNNSTNDELFANSELNLLPDPSTEFLNLNSNSNGAINIISTEPLSTSHYNVGFPELSLDRIVPTNILPPQTLQYHQQQQSHQLSPILSDNFNLYLNHDNNLIPKNQLNKSKNQLDSVLINKSSSTLEFKNAAISEPPHINLARTDSSIRSIAFQQLPNNCHQHLEHINGNSICQTNLSNTVLTASNLPNGQLNINNFTSNCLDLPVPPNVHSNVISLESNHYKNVQVLHLNNLNAQNQNELVVPSLKKPPPKFINTFKPLIEPIKNVSNSSVAKLIAESTKTEDPIPDNNIEIIKNQAPEVITTNIQKEELNVNEKESSNTGILNKKNLTKKKRKKKEVKVTTSLEGSSSHKSKTVVGDEIDGHKIISEQKIEHVIESPIQKDSIQSFIEQFRADKDLTLITSEPSYQNVQASDEPLKKNLKRKTKVNKKTAKKTKLDLDKNENVNDSPFSHNFKNILLDVGNVQSKLNLISAAVNNQAESQISLINDNTGVFSANDNCNYELYPSPANQIDAAIPSMQQQLSEFVYPTAPIEHFQSQKRSADLIQQITKANNSSSELKANFNEKNEKESIIINNNEKQFKESQELNEILDTSDLYALLSSNNDLSFKGTSFEPNPGSTVKSIDKEANTTSKEIKIITTEVHQPARELIQPQQKKVTVKKKRKEKKKSLHSQSVNSKNHKIETEKLKTKISDNSELTPTQNAHFSINSTKTVSDINNSILKKNNNSLRFQRSEFDQIEGESMKSGIYRKLLQPTKEIFKASENVFITKSNPSGAVIKMNQFEEIVLNFKNEYSNILPQNQQQFQRSVFSSFPVTDCTNTKLKLQDNKSDTNCVNATIIGSNSNLYTDSVYCAGNEKFNHAQPEPNADNKKVKGTLIKITKDTVDSTSVSLPNTKLSQDGTIRNPKYSSKDKLMILAYDILKLKNKNFTANREQMKLEVHDPITKKSIAYKIIQPHDLSLNSKRLSDLLRLTPSKLNKLNKKKKSKINEQSSSLLTKSQPIVRTRYGRILKPTLPNDEIISLKVDKTKKLSNNKINNILKEHVINNPPNGLQNVNITINNPTQVIPNKPAEKSPAVAKYKCQTCNKLFMGKRLQKHYISNPDHNPAIRKSRDIYELSLYKFLVEKIKNSSENEDNRVELFLNEISDLVEQLQIRSSKLVQSTSGMHLVNSKNCKILGIPEGHYSIDINGIDAIPDPITIDECDSNRLIAPPPVPRLDYSISLDDTITAKLNLSDNCNAPSEESLLRTVNDLVQTDIDKLDEKHLHYDQCDNAVEAMPIKVNETPILDLSLLFNNN